MPGLCRTSLSLVHSSKSDTKSPDCIASIGRSFDLDREIPYPTLRERTIVSAPAQFASKRRPVCTENSIRVDDVTESPKLGE